MIVTREFRIGNRRYLKGEHYTEKDAQKWVDVTSQRVAGTTYTNNTGKPIMVSISLKD